MKTLCLIMREDEADCINELLEVCSEIALEKTKEPEHAKYIQEVVAIFGQALFDARLRASKINNLNKKNIVSQ